MKFCPVKHQLVFMKRWPMLKLVKPQKLSIARAKSASPDAIKRYFQKLLTLIIHHGLSEKPPGIYNIHETGISTYHSPLKVVCGKILTPQSVTSQRSTTVTHCWWECCGQIYTRAHCMCFLGKGGIRSS